MKEARNRQDRLVYNGGSLFAETIIEAMPVKIRTPDQLEKMRVAGRLCADVLDMIGEHVKPGVSTGELDRLCHDFIVNVQKAIPSPLNYKGFPKSICTSVNQVVCHGIPSDSRILKKGDIINIDATVTKDGWIGDSSRMYPVGEVEPHARRLCEVTKECLMLGIAQVKPGATLGDIGHAIQQHAEKSHYSVVREYCGHGIGDVFHDDPQVMHFGKAGSGLVLKEGMTFTIEPMINLGSRHTKVKSDGWTVETQDGRLSAQWEHTLAVTATGAEIFTVSPKGL